LCDFFKSMKLSTILFFSLAVFACKPRSQPNVSFRHINTENPKDTVVLSFSQRFTDTSEFAYNQQWAHFKSNEIEIKGGTNEQNFMLAFQAFPWMEQVTAPKIKGGSLPSMAIRNNIDDRELGIAIKGKDSLNYSFVMFFGYPERMKSAKNQSKEQVIQSIKMFFAKDYTKLEKRF